MNYEFKCTNYRVIDESLAHCRKWCLKRHSSLTVGAQTMRID